MAFDLTGYVTVPERLTAAKEKYPDGRFVSRIIDCPFPGFLAVEAKFYRTADDPTPAVGLAWEPVPGKTPYTKDSELQNAETSAWGRALIAAFVVDASKGIASAEDVRNRSQNGETPSQPVERLEDGSFPILCPACGSDVYDNRESNDKRQEQGKKRTPEYKCKRCDWLSWEQDAFRPGGAVDDLITSLGDVVDVVEVVPTAPFSQWDHLLDMCKIFKGWSGDKQQDMAVKMCETMGFSPSALKAKQPEKVFLKLSEAYYADQPDEAPF